MATSQINVVSKAMIPVDMMHISFSITILEDTIDLIVKKRKK
jgi:hypothetical protein